MNNARQVVDVAMAQPGAPPATSSAIAVRFINGLVGGRSQVVTVPPGTTLRAFLAQQGIVPTSKHYVRKNKMPVMTPALDDLLQDGDCVTLTQSIIRGNCDIADDIAQGLEALDQLGTYDNRVRAGLPPLSDEDISRESIY